MFVYGGQDDIARDRPALYLEADQDFLRRGSGFIIRGRVGIAFAAEQSVAGFFGTHRRQ
jgi:hypothetical protein